MAKYTEVELEIIAFEAEDVITSSYDDDGYENL
jgi:hypothetical protein